MTSGQVTGAGPAMPVPGRMTEAELRALYERLRAQVPWGPDDRRRALNYITPAEVLAACGQVRLGRTVSLAAPVEDWAALDNPDPAEHQMKGPLGVDAGREMSFSMDRIAMNIHGNADTHIDALCHVIFDGELYHGVPGETVTETGAAQLSIAVAANGIVGRGVLLDVPRSRGVPWLEPGDHVTEADLLAAERDQGVQVGRGDIVLVRVGHRLRRAELGPWDASAARAGLHPSLLVVAAERQIAVFRGDRHDVIPVALVAPGAAGGPVVEQRGAVHPDLGASAEALRDPDQGTDGAGVGRGPSVVRPPRRVLDWADGQEVLHGHPSGGSLPGGLQHHRPRQVPALLRHLRGGGAEPEQPGRPVEQCREHARGIGAGQAQLLDRPSGATRQLCSQLDKSPYWAIGGNVFIGACCISHSRPFVLILRGQCDHNYRCAPRRRPKGGKPVSSR